MKKPDLQQINSVPLSYLLSIPAATAAPGGSWPLLCFLHGYDEGAPTPLKKGLLRHGPLAAGTAASVRAEFIMVAPQLPAKGDLWYRYAGAVKEIVQEVQARFGADAGRCYLTGFSFGANGVFDLALAQPGFWAALWPVDPTRVPEADPDCPIWFSSGEISRGGARFFIKRLDLEMPGNKQPGDRVYEDREQDHGGTARLAYQEERIYRWLLAHRLPGAGAI